ncbi:UdgX family uracil-DNA binding protein [Chelativorans sp. AA-79]|uniref:UdgX family uracil-DNA binding protein n=1 Tax=Chelativorans sp. AA-79 TaxID=3028735 RepID=UPI0023F6C2FA|nr:UdgX family uracil-DNA binding protein [Chelativorans sp. AA-79]WEX11630.1 UdgX family uracil-DNA binding protein [Chelativorans sp. AA-79]
MFSTGEELSLFSEDGGEELEPLAVKVPRAYPKLVAKVICHNAPDRFALLYRLLWRIHSGERHVLQISADPDVICAMRYARAVDKVVYRMHAYVRFAEREIEGEKVFAAWHEPQHRVLRLAAPFFVDRFSNMEWLIATPFGTIAWRRGELIFGPPAARPAERGDEVLDELWTAYYRTTFNPARLRVKAMVAQMPKRHWNTMPETALIPDMVQTAGLRVEAMQSRTPDTPPRFAAAVTQRIAAKPPETGHAPLDVLRREVQECRLCPLHGPATQAVFGEGAPEASIMFVGEQPGDQEDLNGRPFVGPAGQIFDRALAEAGIERAKAYVTNAVKHFKFEPRGKRRVHMKPSAGEITKCRFWLRREIVAVRPKLVVALGATAMLGLTGQSVAVTKERGNVLFFDGLSILVTVHPSYILRLPEPDMAELEYGRFVADLKTAGQRLAAA